MINKGKKLYYLLPMIMILILLLSDQTKIYAKDSPTVVFDGNKKAFVIENADDFGDSFKNIAPGESKTLDIKIENTGSDTCIFYFRVKALSDLLAGSNSSSTTKDQNAIYYANIYCDDNLMLSETLTIDTNGLLGLSKDNKEYKIATLKPGETAKLTLDLTLDGKSMGNAYQDKEAQLQFQFRCETVDKESTITTNNQTSTTTTTKPSTTTSKTVKTNDPTRIFLPVALLICSGILILFIAYKKRRNHNA